MHSIKTTAQTNTVSVDLSNVSPGVYFLKVGQRDGLLAVYKLVSFGN